MAIVKTLNRQRRKNRIRSKISGDAQRPRVSVFKSNKYISAQAIDDTEGKTLAAFSSSVIKDKKTFSEKAKESGLALAKNISDLGIKEIVFDRNGYSYEGRVRAFAEGLREGGLKF